ncbi:uncharacterized protein ACBT57_004349 isoform 1-T1 [Dama dama]
MSAPSRGKGLQSHRARGLCALPLSPTFSPGTRRTLATVTQVRDIPFLPLDIVISERHLELWLSSGDHKEPRLQKTEDDKKPRHHFADKSPSSQSYVFPVVMYGCESWTIKKAECQRIDGFRTVVLEKTLKTSLDSKKIKLLY